MALVVGALIGLLTYRTVIPPLRAAVVAAQRIAASERAWRFEIRRGDEHRHAHFHCDRCGQVLCLEDVPSDSKPALPAGFELDRSELVLHGACADCGRRGLKMEAR